MPSAGSFRTLRGQSSSNGSRTYESILANGGASSGAGSFVRIFNWYAKQGLSQQFYENYLFRVGR